MPAERISEGKVAKCLGDRRGERVPAPPERAHLEDQNSSDYIPCRQEIGLSQHQSASAVCSILRMLTEVVVARRGHNIEVFHALHDDVPRKVRLERARSRRWPRAWIRYARGRPRSGYSCCRGAIHPRIEQERAAPQNGFEQE